MTPRLLAETAAARAKLRAKILSALAQPKPGAMLGTAAAIAREAGVSADSLRQLVAGRFALDKTACRAVLAALKRRKYF